MEKIIEFLILNEFVVLIIIILVCMIFKLINITIIYKIQNLDINLIEKIFDR